MMEYTPEGTTGDGRCHRRCEVGRVTETGGYEHPARVRDMKCKKRKNALAPDWVREMLTCAVKARTNKKQNIVIDLFAGWQSLAPICKEMGLNYIAIDIEGDRNVR